MATTLEDLVYIAVSFGTYTHQAPHTSLRSRFLALTCYELSEIICLCHKAMLFPRKTTPVNIRPPYLFAYMLFYFCAGEVLTSLTCRANRSPRYQSHGVTVHVYCFVVQIILSCMI